MLAWIGIVASHTLGNTCHIWQVNGQLIDLQNLAGQPSVLGVVSAFFQPFLSHLQNIAGQPSLFRSDIIHESNFVKQPASLGRSTVRDLNLPASAGQPSLFWVENIFLNAFTSEKWRLTCHVLQVTVQWLKKVLATLKTDGWPARFCRSFNWRLTCHIWQVYPQENLWINLPASAGQPSLFSPAIYGRNSQVEWCVHIVRTTYCLSR